MKKRIRPGPRAETPSQDRRDPEAAASALVQNLDLERLKRYLRQPIPNDTDESVRALVQAYVEAGPDLKAAILVRMVGRLPSVLGAFAERHAVAAVRAGSVDPIRLGLVAIGMALPREDFREAQLSLSKLDHSARLLGTDMAELYQEVAGALPATVAEEMSQFLSRADRGPSLLRRMGFATTGIGPDFLYKSASPYEDDDVREVARQLTAPLTLVRYEAFLWQPIPHHLDDDVRAVVRAYLDGGPDLRAAILDCSIGDPADVLKSFAERQAVEAVRIGSVEPIRLGLTAIGISLPRADDREAQLGLTKLDYSARLLGTDLADVFKDVAGSLAQAARTKIELFLTLDGRDASLLKSMGFAAKGTGADFYYDDASPYDNEGE